MAVGRGPGQGRTTPSSSTVNPGGISSSLGRSARRASSFFGSAWSKRICRDDAEVLDLIDQATQNPNGVHVVPVANRNSRRGRAVQRERRRSRPFVGFARTVPTSTPRSSPVARVRTARWSRREATLDGQDPVSYILSANVNRRNLTKGQRAMAAVLCKFSLQSTRMAAEVVGVSHQRVHQASLILEHAPELADAVMAGTVPLDVAYAEARQRKEAKASREEKARRDEVLTGC